jgi:hypothetical protein
MKRGVLDEVLEKELELGEEDVKEYYHEPAKFDEDEYFITDS